jgi:hypothetical protein
MLIVIESKDNGRKLGVKSPDRAEAVMLAFGRKRGPGILDSTNKRVAAEARRRQ